MMFPRKRRITSVHCTSCSAPLKQPCMLEQSHSGFDQSFQNRGRNSVALGMDFLNSVRFSCVFLFLYILLNTSTILQHWLLLLSVIIPALLHVNKRLGDIKSQIEQGKEVKSGLLTHLLLTKELNMEEIYANLTEMLLAGVDTVNMHDFLLFIFLFLHHCIWLCPTIIKIKGLFTKSHFLMSLHLTFF